MVIGHNVNIAAYFGSLLLMTWKLATSICRRDTRQRTLSQHVVDEVTTVTIPAPN